VVSIPSCLEAGSKSATVSCNWFIAAPANLTTFACGWQWCKIKGHMAWQNTSVEASRKVEGHNA